MSAIRTKNNRAVKPQEVAAIKKEIARLEAWDKRLKAREKALAARESGAGRAQQVGAMNHTQSWWPTVTASCAQPMPRQCSTVI